MKRNHSENDSCVICGAMLLSDGVKLNLARHAAHATNRAFGKDGEASKASLRDPQLLVHAERLRWSQGATGTM